MSVCDKNVNVDACTEIVRKKIKDVKHLKNINTDDIYIQRFLYSTGCLDTEEAFQRMLLYHETIVKIPDYYPKLGPKDIKDVLDMNFSVVLDDCDKEGRPIYYEKMERLDPARLTSMDVIAAEEIWFEYILSRHPEKAGKGLCMLVDVSGYSWKLFKWLTPSALSNGRRKIDAIPFKEIQVHIVNHSLMVDVALKLAWPFVPEERKKTVHCYFNNYETLFEHIDKSVLPAEYGGENEVNFTKLTQKLYDRNEEISRNFQLYKNVIKL
ncbi:alpha-tocopherol transfer protein isoform X2 [Diabrotica virgifera virgifera]|uniref:Alpha-tocopherol transfer protein-like n=1 Tax=Diabrotica virgifera virgifera TaxID=50390 RepID=A0A6P7F954_DIAVI|nr:alpha-tocopherol transfer protein isoform X2 [Diabrotica virgifera virgifera]